MYDLFNQGPAPDRELTGAELRDAGIIKALTHANKKINQWSEKAYVYALEYIETVKQFKTEDLRAYAEAKGFEIPPSKRAWGGIVLRLARNKKVIKSGHATVDNPKAHKCLATLWSVVNN